MKKNCSDHSPKVVVVGPVTKKKWRLRTVMIESDDEGKNGFDMTIRSK